jgi:N-acetylglucosamine kinase-like BadF-type ATPase
MERYFLGVDIGSTKSHALIADDRGRAIGFGKAGPGNWETVGWENTRQVLQSIVDQAIEASNIARNQITGAGFGIAGYDWEEDLRPHQEIIESLQLNAPYQIVNDSIIGLIAGGTKGWGVVISAGTSNNCRGRDQEGKEGRIVGSGVRFGEFGGAYEIIWKAIHAVAAAWTQRSSPTNLTDKFIEITGAADISDLISGLVRDRYSLSAKHAPDIFLIAEEGDEVAQEIICWAGRELGDLAVGVIRQLNFQNIGFEVVLAGSLFKGSSMLSTALKEKVLIEAPKAKFVRLKEPPVVGGVLLGMEAAGEEIYRYRDRLLESSLKIL